MLSGRSVVAVVLIGTGGAGVLFAVLADALGYGTKGVGLSQWGLAIAGALLVLAGVRATPSGRERLRSMIAPEVPVTFGQGVWLALWIAVVTGLFDLAHLVIRKAISGEFISQPLHVVWMAPLSYVVLFVPLAVLLGVIGRFVPAITLRVLVFCIALLAVWGQIIVYPSIDGGAGLVLSAGLAVYLARACSSHAERVHRLARRTTPWLIGVIAVAGAAIPVWESVEEQRAVDALPEARAGDPNVLLIVLDTVRADHLSPYGYHRDTTPRIADLAKSGVVFDWPITPSCWTLPSHATFFTGRFPFEHEADWFSALDDTYPTLAEVLGERGYATGGFVGNLAYCLAEEGVARGFQRYEDFYVNPTVAAFSTALGGYVFLRGSRLRERVCVSCYGVRNDAPTVTGRFLEWLDEIDGEERPFFAFLNYFDAHHIYEPPPPYDTKFRGDDRYEKKSIQRLVNAYDGCIASIDEHVGTIIDRLRERGVLENTLVIITGDHGELFGEHGYTGHGNCLHRSVLRCPLVIRPPGGIEARRVSEIVSLRDLPATILDLVNHGGTLPGSSLAPLWRGASESSSDPRSPAFAQVTPGLNLAPKLLLNEGPMRSLTAGGRHYILNGDDSEELYDLEADPMREQNLVETPEGAAQAAEMRGVIERLLAK